ncbi:MAG TPA: hypothetical protein VLA77_01115 [Candidatus Saccharimonadales bacterium]|nr:hypothetical protein [Candidatus Saccharimonadales bacterium]
MVIHPHHYSVKKQKRGPLDLLVYFFMIATPLFEIPQAIAIYSSKDAASVSLLTWSFFWAASVVWFMYGYKNRLVPIMVTYGLYFIVEAVIVAGILMYS